MKKFLIIDGNSLINRAYYGIRPLSNREGLPTNAIYGFLSIIKKHLDGLKPDYLACAFDVHQPTFRHKAYAEYKAGRRPMPDDLKIQMPYAKQVAEALGFLIIECPGYEADDVIGTAAHMGDMTGEIESYILTGDRDSLQLISDRTTVVLAKNKEDVLFTPAKFREEYGIGPDQFVDVKALMGDSSDNIPGVPGIGEKTALKLIATAGSLDSLYGDPDLFGQKGAVRTKLLDGRESAYMSKELATICREAPIPGAETIFAERKVDSARFAELCRMFEFVGMARRFGVDEAHEFAVSHIEGKQINEKEIATFDEIKSDGCVFVYYECGDFYVLSGDTSYKVASPANDSIVNYLSANDFICHDYKALLRKIGVPGDGIRCRFDTKLASYLLNPGKKYELKDISLLFTGSEPQTPAECVKAISEIYAITEKQLEEADMSKLMTEIEIPLSVVLAEMEDRGFRIDADGIRNYSRELLEKENALAQQIWFEAGHEFNINSPKQLGDVLFDEIGLPAGKKTKNGYSTDADTLEELRPYHAIIGDVLYYRQISKLRGTYGDSLADQADSNGRIHTNLNQTGTATGRLASNDPNLQNIPVREELGRELRKYFVADEGYVLIDADYSQIELRILAELSKDPNMSSAFISGEDIHATVASQVFNIPIDEVTPELRRRAKAVNFGIVYGIGDFSLAKDIGTSRKKAKEYINSYLENFSAVDSFLKTSVEDAKNNGYTATMFGRRRNIPELKSSNFNLRSFGERVAMNSPIQGSAADVIKIAMINVRKALKEEGIDAHLIMQVHDELIVEAHEDCAERAAEILVYEMENAVRTTVPLTADCGMGQNWLEAK